MVAPNVSLREIDLSTRVPSFPGVFGAMVIPARKGPLEPYLVTSDTELLRVFTPNETVEVGDSTAFFSATAYLNKSNKLWVRRAVGTGALFGGAVFKETGATYPTNFSLPAGLADPTAYIFDSLPDVPGVAEVTTYDFTGQTGATYDVATGLYVDFRSALNANAYYAWFNVTDGVAQADPAPGGTGIQVDILVADTDAVIAAKFDAAVAANPDFNGGAVAGAVSTITNAATGATTDATAGTSGAVVIVATQGVTEINAADEAMLIYQADPGAWGDDILVKLTNFATDPDLVKEPDSFLIEVYKQPNLNVPVETFLASRDPGKLDGFGRNIFVEDILEGSNYIRALSNPAVDDAVTPLDQLTPLALFGGDDGTAVTDGDIVTALQDFRAQDTIAVTLLMDGGFAVPSVALEQDDICQSRQDCVSIISTPISDEASANYLNDLVEYRQVDLNLNSSYSALYTPHVKILDRFNDRNIYVSPDGYAGGAISETQSNFEIWFPVGGFRRGVLNVLDVRRRFTQGELDVLYDAGLNPIRFVTGRGIAIWGQKTLSTRPSALDRLNVRLMLIVVEPLIKEAMDDFLFELNDEDTRSLARQTIESAVARVEARRGLTSFQVIADDSNNTPDDIDNHCLNIDVYLSPTPSLEFIKVRVIITRTGVDFSTLT